MCLCLKRSRMRPICRPTPTQINRFSQLYSARLLFCCCCCCCLRRRRRHHRGTRLLSLSSLYKVSQNCHHSHSSHDLFQLSHISRRLHYTLGLVCLVGVKQASQQASKSAPQCAVSATEWGALVLHLQSKLRSAQLSSTPKV